MRQPSIVIIDYDVGNTFSVANAVRVLGYTRLKVSADVGVIQSADALILPGVGAFAACAENLRARGLDRVLNEEVLGRKKPILGICVGMQLMATASEENGLHPGLDWVKGRVVKLSPGNNLRVPHVGWNDIQMREANPLFNNLSESPNFYFDHSYHFLPEGGDVSAVCVYGAAVTAVINRQNIFGVQFHPEKSQNNGLRLFRNFFNLVRPC